VAERKKPILTADEAARLVPSGATVTVSSMPLTTTA